MIVLVQTCIFHHCDIDLHDMTLVEVTELLLAAEFQFAKTMPETPHHYTLRATWEGGIVFEEVVQFIRYHGTEEIYLGETYICLYLEGHKYWTMGGPLDQTRLINRAEAAAGCDRKTPLHTWAKR